MVGVVVKPNPLLGNRPKREFLEVKVSLESQACSLAKQELLVGLLPALEYGRDESYGAWRQSPCGCPRRVASNVANS